MTTYPFDPAVHPELVNVRDRTADRPDVERLYFGEDSFAQGADVTEGFSREILARKAVGDLIASDGDRLVGGDIIVDQAAGTVQMTAGTIYLLGKPRAVEAALLTDVPMAGTVAIGVRVTTVIVTAEDDAIYYGLVDGTESFGEEGAVRTTLSVTWAFDGDGGAGDFYTYALLTDGVVVSQDAPPTLSGVQKQIARYDYDAHGHYIVSGCAVRALGLNGTKRIFSIGAGVANVNGTKVIRNFDTRYEVVEDYDVRRVDLEYHTFVDRGDGSAEITVRHPPIAAIVTVQVTKERTVTLTKGVSGSIDALPDDSVISLISVVQGATTYVAEDDYKRTGDAVDWTPGGAEPATGSTYDVTYRYYDAVNPSEFSASVIVAPGGVNGTDCFVSYDYKVARWDRILLNSDATFSYLKGVSSSEHPYAPQKPGNALSLCIVKNDWYSTPVIVNDGTQALTFDDLQRMKDKLVELYNVTLIERLKSDAIARAPGQVYGVFTDPFLDDSYRDLGAEQDAAIFEGTMQIAIDADIRAVRLPSLGMLDWTLEAVISQPLSTGCEKINPYQNFNPLPIALTINPSQDFWTETENVTLSAVTQVFGSGNATRVSSRRTNVTTEVTELATLRAIDIDFSISGFGEGETLSVLTFDGLDVNPGGLVGDASGMVSGSFTIPEGVASGTKEVYAEGGSGAKASVNFVGQGKLETISSQSVTVMERFQLAAPSRSHGRSFGDPPDPQAQSFVLPGRGRFIGAVALKFCAFGDRSKPVDIDIVIANANAEPSDQVVATARVDMTGVIANVMTTIPLDVPIYQPEGTYFAVVIKTDDADHSISVATLGDFDATAQRWVSAQPYTAGDRFDGSNALTWLVHPDSDVTFDILANVFSPVTKTFNLGTFAVEGISDIIVLANVINAEAEASVAFTVTLSDGSGLRTFTVQALQTLELTDFFTGNVTVKAVLSGTARISPFLSRDINIVFGTMRTTGTYVSRSMVMGNPVDMRAVFSAMLPTGSGVTVEVEDGDGVFQPMTFVFSQAIDGGYVTTEYGLDDHVAPSGGRLRVTLTGTPAARPALADFRAFAM